MADDIDNDPLLGGTGHSESEPSSNIALAPEPEPKAEPEPNVDELLDPEAQARADMQAIDDMAEDYDDMSDLPPVPDEGDVDDDAGGFAEGKDGDDEEVIDTVTSEEHYDDDASAGEGAKPSAKEDGTPSEDDEEPEAQELSDEVIEEGIRAGLSMAEIRELGENLPLALELQRRAAGGEDGEPEGSAAEDSAAEEEVELDPEIYDSDIIALVQSERDKRKAAEASLGEVQAQVQQIQYQQTMNQLDQEVAALGDAWKDTLGEGATASVSEEQLEARRAIVVEMDIIQSGRTQRGLKELGFKELFQKAINSAHGDKAKSIDKQKLESQVTKRKGSLINRSARRSSTLDTAKSPRQRAVSAVAQKMRDAGMLNADDQMDDDDGLLG